MAIQNTARKMKTSARFVFAGAMIKARSGKSSLFVDVDGGLDGNGSTRSSATRPITRGILQI